MPGMAGSSFVTQLGFGIIGQSGFETRLNDRDTVLPLVLVAGLMFFGDYCIKLVSGGEQGLRARSSGPGLCFALSQPSVGFTS
ncbi:MAG: hypothetical protein AAF566_03480 [Pseudomonadota bacterium]